MNPSQIREHSFALLGKWLESCTRGGKISRNTVAVGIVIFDHLRLKCPVTAGDMLSKGKEIKGARAGLTVTLGKYGIPSSYLKEATTRQVPQDGQALLDLFDWGALFDALTPQERDQLLLDLIELLVGKAKEWLSRQSLRLDIDRGQTPSYWVHLILDRSEGRSGGIVEQHLVGAKLSRRYQEATLPNHAAHAADVQTNRHGDFQIQKTVYHVTGAPTPNVIEKCQKNLKSGLHPILLVPASKKERAVALAEVESVESQITIMSIEDFVALNIIEMAIGEQRDFFGILKEIVGVYNQRLAEVETDMSLQIEVR